MNVRTFRHCAWPALVACLVVQPSHAELLVSGGAGFSQLSSYDDVDEGFAWRAVGGYRDARYPLYVELQYLDSGDIEIDGLPGVEIGFDGFALAAGYRMVVDSLNGSDVIFKAGGYLLDAEARGPGGRISDDGEGALVGIGGNWMLTPHWGVNLDAQILFGVEDFANDEDLTLVTVGVTRTFFQ